MNKTSNVIRFLLIMIILILLHPYPVKNPTDRQTTPTTTIQQSIPVTSAPPPERYAFSNEPALNQYIEGYDHAKAVSEDIEKIFGKPFSQFSETEYNIMMSVFDLNYDEDLYIWSYITGIPIVALRKSSYFFRSNLHLLDDSESADKIQMREAYQHQTVLDPKTGQLSLNDEDGNALVLRSLPSNLIMNTERVGRYWSVKNFSDQGITFEVLQPYLISLQALPYRHALHNWIIAIPLSIVKTYRGKAIYFTNVQGRSFSTTMPVSTTVYPLHAGLKTGVWIEMRSDGIQGTKNNFIHELGHVFDYVVLQGGYASYRDLFQFPEFLKLNAQKESIFGVGDNKVENTPFGYISRYAKTNAQESFAEHFRAFILDRQYFEKKALQEAQEGNPQLLEKYQFMENMIEHTPTTMIRLNKQFMMELKMNNN